MKICCLARPPTEVKSPITRSSPPLWLIAWLYTRVPLPPTPGNT